MFMTDCYNFYTLCDISTADRPWVSYSQFNSIRQGKMAKRIGQSSINWTAIAERVPPQQRSNLISFKTKSDGYLRRVLANPPEPPKINWDLYRQVVPVPGMVDKFQKQYEALQIPFPTDTQTALVEAQWKEVKKSIEQFVAASNANISKYQKEIAETKALLPYNQMTMEDYRDAYPEDALDPLNKPSFWPHTPEDQPDYVSPDQQAHSH